jgi:hypothetical protein
MSISEVIPLESAALATVVARPRATSLPSLVSAAVIAREAVVVAGVVAGLTLVFAPRDLGAGLAPHPAWAAVILLSARYGSRGFGLAFVAVWGAMALTAVARGFGLAPLVTAAGNSVPDLAALVVCVLVAWIASAHERRIADLAARAAELEKKDASDGATIVGLRDAALALRARADRMDHSLTFIREVSARLESGDALASSHAALDLALARTGARAGVVQLAERGCLRTVASVGPWTSECAKAPDLFLDRTIKAAFALHAPVRASELPSPGLDDSDVATPILDDDGAVLGVLALRGVPADSLRHALVHDLGIVAHWCAKASATRGAVVVEAPVATEARERKAPSRALHVSASQSQQFN